MSVLQAVFNKDIETTVEHQNTHTHTHTHTHTGRRIGYMLIAA